MRTRANHFTAFAAAACVALGAHAQISKPPTVTLPAPLAPPVTLGKATSFGGSYLGTSFAVVSWSLSSAPPPQVAAGQAPMQLVDIVRNPDAASAQLKLLVGTRAAGDLKIRGFNAAGQAVETMLFTKALLASLTLSAGTAGQPPKEHLRFNYTQMTTTHP